MTANPHALVCAILSLISGLMGHKLAITQAPTQLKDYIAAATISALCQSVLTAIISHRKDQLYGDRDLIERKFRLGFVAQLCGVLIILAIIAALLIENYRFFFFFVALSLSATLLQNSTYDASSIELLNKDGKFWRHQVAGALVRLALTATLTAIWDLAFFGILIANIGAATAICAKYRRLPTISIRFFRYPHRLYGPAQLKSILTVDGILRALKGQYETVAVSATALTLNKAAQLSPEQSISCLAAVAYVNTVNVLLRQTLSTWEHPDIQRSRLSLGLMTLALFILTSLGAWLARYTSLIQYALPALSDTAIEHVLISCVAAATCFPLTRGFLFSDYLPPPELTHLWQRLATSFLAMLVAFVVMISVNPNTSALLLWPVIVPLSIGFSLQKLKGHQNA